MAVAMWRNLVKWPMWVSCLRGRSLGPDESLGNWSPGSHLDCIFLRDSADITLERIVLGQFFTDQ